MPRCGPGACTRNIRFFTQNGGRAYQPPKTLQSHPWWRQPAQWYQHSTTYTPLLPNIALYRPQVDLSGPSSARFSKPRNILPSHSYAKDPADAKSREQSCSRKMFADGFLATNPAFIMLAARDPSSKRRALSPNSPFWPKQNPEARKTQPGKTLNRANPL